MHWNNFKKGYKKKYNPVTCLACGTNFNINYHHLKTREDRPDLYTHDLNIAPLCRRHHLIIGHLGNWNYINPNFFVDLLNIAASSQHKFNYILFHKLKKHFDNG
jgi:hypothetical protein